jgi:hypothetical protein
VLLPLVFACTDATNPNGTSLSTGSGDFPDQGPDLVVSDVHVNSYEADWIFPSAPIPIIYDLVVLWDDVTSDAYGVDREPDSYDTAVLIQAGVDRLDLIDAFELGDPADVILGLWTAPASGRSDLQLSQFPGFDPTTQLVENADESWLLALADDQDGRLDIRTGMVVTPDPEQESSLLRFPSLGTRIDFASSFDGDTLRTEPGYAEYTLDFAGITTNAYGEPLDLGQLDTLFIGAYSGRDEADDWANDIHDLQSPAAGWWSLPLTGSTQVSLGDAAGTDGAFPGFTRDFVYVIGASCSTCWAPVPAWVVTVDVD